MKNRRGGGAIFEPNTLSMGGGGGGRSGLGRVGGGQGGCERRIEVFVKTQKKVWGGEGWGGGG